MNKYLAIPLLATTINASALELFKAEYTVFKDGKQIGSSSIELTHQKPLYTITDRTTGTHGMASFLGFKRSEVTIFIENNGVFNPHSYAMQQKVAFKKRTSSYQIDNETKMVYGSYKGKEWQDKIPDDFLTPNLVALKLSQDICADKTENLNYKVLKNGELKNYSFTIVANKDNIIEINKLHNNPNTITKTWLDTQQNCLPIKTYHQAKGEDTLESKLVKLTIKQP
ncbi:MAG: hypothetical protein L3J53_00200 [Proteobacteria bacterium]|nr:hypothetical protein [Pseudomonadota bacterium]